MRFTRALCRLPGANFAAGLTQYAGDGPDFARTLAQHRSYVEALEQCGLAVVTLPADLAYPDGTFVEDTAVLTPAWAVMTIPGAPSRAGERGAIAAELRPHFGVLREIVAPGTLDGGDICDAGDHFFIGLSKRTNAEGARQLSEILATFGCTSSLVDIRHSETLLHLKTGIAYIGDHCLVVTPDLPPVPEFSRFDLIAVDAAESYAANCVRVNDRVLIASGFPKFAATLRARGYQPLALDMSEFRKMDGGLSCLSLRY